MVVKHSRDVTILIVWATVVYMIVHYSSIIFVYYCSLLTFLQIIILFGEPMHTVVMVSHAPVMYINNRLRVKYPLHIFVS